MLLRLRLNHCGISSAQVVALLDVLEGKVLLDEFSFESEGISSGTLTRLVKSDLIGDSSVIIAKYDAAIRQTTRSKIRETAEERGIFYKIT